MQRPSETAQDFFAQAITITRRACTMVTGSVAFDAEEVAARTLRIDYGEIDSIPGTADLRANDPAYVAKGCRDFSFERRFEVVTAGRVDGRQRRGATRCEIEKGLEILNAACPTSGQVDLVRTQARKYHQLAPRSCYRDVEPTFTALPVQRPEIHCNATLGIRPVTDRKKDHVALIALDVLKIFNEHLFRNVFPEKSIELRFFPAGRVEKIFDQCLLCLAEGHDADRLPRFNWIAEPTKNLVDDSARFDRIGPAARTLVDAGNLSMLDAGRSSVGGWECQQTAAVVLAIAERDQRLVAAAVMPIERKPRHTRGDTVVEHRFKVFDFNLIVAGFSP